MENDPLTTYVLYHTFGAYSSRLKRACSTHRLAKSHLAHYVGVEYITARDRLNKLMGDAAMVRKARENEKQGEFLGFLNINLSEADKQALEALGVPDLDALWAWVAALTYAGYKFSFSWDTYSGAQQVAVFCWNEDDPNYGHALSARHPDLDTALQTLHYKHQVKAGEVWGSVANPPAPPSWG